MGTLFVVATPIGNLKDITFRALETLKSVNIIACEDTRVTKKLLNYYGIGNKKLISYHEHNEDVVSERLVKILEKEDIALVSDAGTPCISDPGYRLVKKAIERGFKVSPIPGAFAGVAALSASGLPSDKFLFVGFLSTKQTKKKQQISNYASIGYTFVAYESPHRLLDTLNLFAELLPDSQLVIAKEITKIHEKFIYGTSVEVYNFFKENKELIKGEFVILCYPLYQRKEPSKEELKEVIQNKKKEGLTNKQIVKLLIETYSLPRNKAYKLVHDVD